MLDSSALSQLSELKANIRADKDIQPGTVRGSQGRFGFVNLDDGREAFLPPDSMARVLPGDRVEVALTENEKNKGKWNAELEKLLESKLTTVFGRYLIRGKGHFVATDMPQFNRWLFIPPKARGKAQEGDFLECHITRHPFSDGKAQVSITEILGKETDPGIEHKITVRKHQLPDQWRDAEQAQTKTIEDATLDLSHLTDLTALPLVTIDAETTQDMDDAVHAEANEQGWLLTVAIADPSSAIAAASPLDKAAWERANTAYLPGRAITMLPESLSHHRFSLVAGATRSALVCQLQVTPEGEISRYQFSEAAIRSHHKLSYDAVATFLENDDTKAVPDDAHTNLQALDACAQALNQYRAKHMLLMEEREDFELQLDENGRIANIVCQPRNRAQQLVEESMLATNRSAGDFFANQAKNPQQCDGIFSAHAGLREERLAGIKDIIAKELPELVDLDLQSREGYQQLVQTLQNSDQPDQRNFLQALRLMLQAGQLTHSAKPHVGLGMTYYATVTSPIRRYNDLHNHRAIKALLAGEHLAPFSDESLAQLQERIGRTRASARDLEQWLICHYMEQQKLQEKLAGKPQALAGKVARVTSNGLSIQLSDTGINGFACLDSKVYKFNAERMTLTRQSEESEAHTLRLGQTVTVTLKGINFDKKQIDFELLTDD